jgi:hypothetical protein
LKEGDEAYDQAMQELRQSQDDAYQQAGYQATIGAGQEAQRMYGMDSGTRQQQFGERQAQGEFGNTAANTAFGQRLAGGAQGFTEDVTAGQRQDSQRAAAGQEQLAFGQQQFQQGQAASGMNNQVRQQQISEALQRRGFSLNEINAILSGQQVAMPNMPGFNQANAAQPVQSLAAAQLTGQANLDAFNARQGGIQGLLGGIGSVAQAAPFAFSDRRLKKNIRRIGTYKSYPLYEYDYIWGQHAIGVMSDEIPAEFVVKHSSGYDMVNYGRL